MFIHVWSSWLTCHMVADGCLCVCVWGVTAVQASVAITRQEFAWAGVAHRLCVHAAASHTGASGALFISW